MNRIRILAVLLLLASLACFGQVSGTLSGSVLDPAGGAVPNANVQLFIPGGSTPALATKTSSDGLFRITGIRPASYEVRVEAPGFSKYVTPAVVIDPARETSLPPFKLEVGSVTTTVEVKTESENVQTTTTEVANTVTMTQVEKLPVVDRSPLSLIGTQPGVLSTGADTTTINGQRTSFTNVTMNGVNVQDNFIRTNALDYLPNLLLMGQVAEFTVSTSNMDASQSGASAVSFIAPSGNNSYHGALYWSNRNNALSANTWFNNQSGVKRPFLNQNQIGGVISGAIIKDKWFFYGNYEAFRLRQNQSYTRTILTNDARNGIFTYTAGGAVQKANILTLMGASINPVSAASLAKVPTADNINNFTTGDSSASLLRNTGGYSFLNRYNRTRDNVTGTSDYILSSKHTFSGMFSWNRDVLDRPGQSNDYSVIPKVANNNPVKLVTGSWRFVPTPTLTNELRGGFNLAPGVFTTSETFPSAIIDGYSWSNPLNTFRNQGRNTNTFNLNDNASWVRGKHFVKFGGGFQRIRVSPYDDAGITPTYTIGLGTGHAGLTSTQLPGISSTDLATANALLASLTGALTSSTQTFNVTNTTSGFVNGAQSLRHFQYDAYAGYIQDNWRIKPHLTIEAGLRYEFNLPLKELNNLELVPQGLTGNPNDTLLNPVASFNFANGGFYNSDKKNFGPRIGFAWDPFGDGKTSVRGGYGLYFGNDEVVTTVRNNVETNAGLQFASTASGLSSFANNPTPVVVPTYKVPRTQADNYALNSAAALGVVNPGLRTPYVGQYSLSVQHDFNGTIIDVRYVGNHGTKLLRGVDVNQVIINNGLLDDFKRARSNAYLASAAGKGFTAAYNSGIAGSQPLTFFPNLPNGGYLTNSSVVSYLQQNQVGQLAYFYQVNGVNGNTNFFKNYNTLGANYITNGADSSYNSLQIDVHRRLSHGLTYQFGYTWSKVLSNTAGDQQTNFEPLLDNNSPQAERAPAPFDLRHIFKANGTYDLPMGPGHNFNPRSLSRVIGGWSLGSIMSWQSGTPFSILDGARGTLNRGGRSNYNTVNPLVTGSALTDLVKFRMTGAGPYYMAASAIGADGRGTAADGSAAFTGQAFANPDAGTIGVLQRRMFHGPWDFNQDFSLMKQVKITEHQSATLRMDATNLWNHATFYVPDYATAASSTLTSINSTSFGKISSTFFGRRLIQFSLYYQF